MLLSQAAEESAGGHLRVGLLPHRHYRRPWAVPLPNCID